MKNCSRPNPDSDHIRIENHDDIENQKIFMSSILDAIPHAVIGLRNRTIIFANPAVRSVFGWDPEELIGKNTSILYRSDEEYEEIGRNFYPTLIHQRTFCQEYHCRRKDGRDFICLVSASRAGDHLKDRMIVATYEDITERKRAEIILGRSQEEMAILVQERTLELQRTYQELAHEMMMHQQEAESRKQMEQRLADIIDFLPDATFAIDDEGKVLIWNQAIEDMTGVKAKDMLGKGDYEYALPFYGNRRPILIDLVFKPYEEIQSQYLYIKKDGNILLTETDVPLVKGRKRILSGKASPLFGSHGRIVGAIESIRDVTERRRAEETLMASEERYRMFINGTDDMAFLKDEQLCYVFINPALAEYFGKEAADIIGKTDFELMPERAARSCRETDLRALESDGVVVSEEKIDRVYESRKFRVKLMDGKVGIGGYIRDVTQQKQLEVQLLQSQKMEAIGTLAGGIAHDFNNLLMGVQGYTSLMMLDVDPSRPHYEKLKGIQDQVQSGADLTRQLLGFARGGRYEIKPTDINQLIGKTSNMFGRTKKEIRIHEKYQRDVWVVEADQGQMEQVLLNLYVNAWQAMPGGGDICLETENITLEQGAVQSFQIPSGKYVKISVTDTGIGMDDKTRQRIFEPFFTTKEMGRGTGLGLATVYGIIKGHSGFMDVISEKGHGSCFMLYLPASDKALPEESKPEEKVLKGHETILLVDDEAVIVEVTKDILETLGYQVMTASTGREAIEIYKKEKDRIDMIILDMIMPGMGGGETLDHLKTINPAAKVILSSGYSLDGEAKKIMDRGVQSFLQKPFRIEQLSQKIRGVLGD